MEELSQRLSLSEIAEEEIKVDVQQLKNVIDRNGRCLVLKVLFDRLYYKESFKFTMCKA